MKPLTFVKISAGIALAALLLLGYQAVMGPGSVPPLIEAPVIWFGVGMMIHGSWFSPLRKTFGYTVGWIWLIVSAILILFVNFEPSHVWEWIALVIGALGLGVMVWAAVEEFKRLDLPPSQTVGVGVFNLTPRPPTRGVPRGGS